MIRNRGMNEILKEGCGDCEVEDGKFICRDPEDSVTCFWANSINETPEKFDFEKNSQPFRSRLRSKLSEHGLLGKEEFVERMRGIYGERNKLRQWTQDTPWITIDKDELRGVLNEHQWERNKETFGNRAPFERLKRNYEKTENMGEKETAKKIQAFDSLIHSQHVTGNIIPGLDVEEKREEFEEEIG